MGVYIKGMEMPESCYDCILTNAFFRQLNCAKLPGMTGFDKLPYTKSRNPACPLHPIPDHGDLIDRDAVVMRLEEWIEKLIKTYSKNDEYVKCLCLVLEELGYDYVVIPAERSEE